MTNGKQVKYKDLESFEQAELFFGFIKCVGEEELDSLICVGYRASKRKALEQLFNYSYDTCMGYNESDTINYVGLSSCDLKIYGTVLMLMSVYLRVLIATEGIWLDEGGVYRWRCYNICDNFGKNNFRGLQ